MLREFPIPRSFRHLSYGPSNSPRTAQAPAVQKFTGGCCQNQEKGGRRLINLPFIAARLLEIITALPTKSNALAGLYPDKTGHCNRFTRLPQTGVTGVTDAQSISIRNNEREVLTPSHKDGRVRPICVSAYVHSHTTGVQVFPKKSKYRVGGVERGIRDPLVPTGSHHRALQRRRARVIDNGHYVR